MSDQTINDFATAVGTAFPWHEVYTPNLDATIDFYTKALGFGTETMQMGEGSTYTMLTVNGQALCGVMDTNTIGMPGIPPHWAAYFSVDDVDARVKSVLEHGGKMLVEPMDVPTVGRMALIQDPQGATLWLYKCAPA